MNVQSELMAFILLLISQCLISGNAFAISTRCSGVNTCLRFSQNAEVDTSIDDASNFLSEWDRSYSVDNPSESTIDNGENARSELKTAIRLLKKKADEERGRDPAAGR